MNTIMRLVIVVLPFIACSCWQPINRPIRSIDRSQSSDQTLLWRKVNDEPLSYVPRKWPASRNLTKQNGEWLVDPQDNTRFFVPKSTFDNLSSGAWRGEALNSMNRYSKEEQNKRNAMTMMVGLPIELTLVTLCVAASGLAGVPMSPYEKEESLEGMYLANPNP